MKSPLLVAAVMLALAASSGAQEVRRVLRIRPGSAVESAALLGTYNTSQLTEGARAASAGGGWTYRIAAPGGSLVRLEVRSEGALSVSPSGDDGKPLPPVSRSGASLAVRVPAAASLGSGVRFHFKATGGQGLLREAVVTVIMADANRNGVPDAVDAFLRGSAPAGAGVAAVPLPTRPFTAFQTGQPYNPAIAPPTDAALVFSADRDVLQGWREAGYVVKTMGGFRQYEPYVKANPHEVQTDRNGSMIVIGGNSYYMIPTTGLNEKQRTYYAEAAANGVYAVCPEEPEIFARAGYSEAFKQEWQALYGAPWEPPHSSMEARVKAERLKMQLCLRQIQAVLGPLANTHPGVRRMLAVHSPVTYPHWGITVPHYALFRLPAVQEVIGQVWTGTARTPTRVAGVRAERTFPLAYVEYSSLVHLLRGTSKPLWALMDPVEDNPDLPMDDYIRNYRETLAASLMFPGLDRFEVMPWPSRIYGRVPADYATVINTVVGALTEMWRYPIRKIEAGSEGVGVLIADSMSYQRGDPHPSDFDGFYGLAMPMVMHGLPLQVLSLDRCSEQGYLSGVRTLLTSYDFMKPDAPECNIGLADWVRKGGSLIMVGGTDPYNGLADSWWRKAGLNSPMEDLFLRLGIEPRRVLEDPGVRNVVSPTELLRGDPEERSLKNRRRYTVDLSPFVRETGSVSVRFEDVSRADGWGPYLASAELRINDVLAASFQAGSELETRFLAEDRNSVCNADARFADGDAYWVYRFDGLPREASVKLTLDMGNGFLVSAYPAPPANRLLEAVASGPGALPAYTPDRMLQRIRVLDGYTLTAYAPPADAQVLYRRAGDGIPIVWHAKVGNGSLIYAGVAPAFFTATSQTDRWIRELTRRAFETNGDTLTFATGFVSRRGPYVAARALAGDISLDGSYVDLLAANLPVVESPQVSAGQAAFLRSAGGSGGSTPSVLAVSGRTTARMETATATAFVVQAPASTVGAARLAAGRRTFVGAKARTLRGEAVAISARQERGTVLLRYDNNPEGVAVRVSWK